VKNDNAQSKPQHAQPFSALIDHHEELNKHDCVSFFEGC